MMAFDQPYGPVSGAYFDQGDPQQICLLHDHLDVSRSNGQAELSLALHAAGNGRGGGLFQARFNALRKELAGLDSLDWTLADIIRCKIRLTPRSEVAQPESFGQWRDAVLDGEGRILVNFFLDSRDGELMRQLALDAVNTLDLTMELAHLGSVRGYPYITRASRFELTDQLVAILGEKPVSVASIEAAFLSLPSSLLQFVAVDRVRSPGKEALIRETAQRALAVLFIAADTSIGTKYKLAPPQPAEEFTVSLNHPRKVLQTTRLNWSFQAFVQQLSPLEIAQHFPLLRSIEPFSNVDIQALNLIPLDPKHATVAKLDLKYTGRGGTQENTTLEFRPGQTVLKSVSTMIPALTHQFKVESRLRVIIAPPSGRGFPKIWPKNAAFENAENPFSIDVSPERADVGIVQLKALDGVFDYCRAVVATITHDGGTTTAEVSRQTPDAWIALAGHLAGAEFILKLEALSLEVANTNFHVLQDGPHTDQEIIISPIDLMVRTPTLITSSLENSLMRFAVLDIRMPGRSHISRCVLRPNGVVETALWRSTIFEKLNYEWRVSAVRNDSTGQSLPMETSGWQNGTDPILKIA